MGIGRRVAVLALRVRPLFHYSLHCLRRFDYTGKRNYADNRESGTIPYMPTYIVSSRYLLKRLMLTFDALRS